MTDDSTAQMPAPEGLQERVERYLQHVGEQLQLERKRRKLRQEDIAERAGRSRGWAGHVERGENRDHGAAALYAATLGMSFAVIVARAEDALVLQERVAEWRDS